MKVISKASVLLLLATPEAAMACEKCFGGGVDTPTTQGISMAMLALLVMVGVVWGGIGAFFVNMRKRARMLEPGNLFVTEEGDILLQSDDNHA